MGDRVKHVSSSRETGFLCHVDNGGVRLVCSEDSSEPWLSGFFKDGGLAEYVYTSRRDGGEITVEEDE